MISFGITYFFLDKELANAIEDDLLFAVAGHYKVLSKQKSNL
jgi:hypothetical protein